jgi:xylitol oxidase
MNALRNWAGNYEYRAPRVHGPATVEQVQELVRRLPRLRVLGSRHSFNDIADSDGDLVTLDGLPRTFELDARTRALAVDGATRYGELGEPLDSAGYALHNLASLPHISVAGACSTATHGSGVGSGNLATAVRGLELIGGDGEIVRLSRREDPEALAGAVVGLGAAGCVTRLELDVEPRYRMRQDVYEALPFARVEDRFDEVASSADSVSFFTDWTVPAFDQVWVKRRVGDDQARLDIAPDVLGARPAAGQLHPIRGLPPEDCTEQLGVPGPWYDRLPHFRMGHTPSAGDELQSEYFVPRERAMEAVLAVFALRTRIAPLVQVSEIRTIAADELWLSPAYRRPSASIHFTWQPDETGVAAAMPLVEAALAPFEPRPHWAKLFAIPVDEVRARYPRIGDFRALCGRLDPAGTFRNPFVDRFIFS